MTNRHVSGKLIFWICILACIVGLIHAAPNIWYRFSLGSEYSGLALWNSQDELDRLAAIREIKDGNYSIKNLYFWEEKLDDRPPSQNTVQVLPYLIAGSIYRLLGWPMDVFVVFLKFICPALIFVLLTIWVAKMTGNWTVSSLVGLAVVLMPTVWSFDLIFFQWQAWWGPHLIFMRPGTQIAVLFWLMALIFWERGLNNQRSVYTLLAAVALSLTVYSYFFYWTFAYLMLLIFAVIAWRRHEQKWLRHTILTLVGSTILSTYAWVQLYQLSRSNIWTAEVFGNALNHLPSLTFFQFLVIAIMLLSYNLCRLDIVGRKEFFLVIAFGLAHIVSVNQHVLTGVVLEIHHYEWFVSPVLLTIFLSILVYRIVQCPNSLKRITYDIKLWVHRRWIKALVSILLVGFYFLLLAVILQSFFPWPTGGWIGKGVRFASEIDRRVLTVAIGLALLIWGLTASKSQRWFRKIAPFGTICILGIVNQVASYHATANWQAPHQGLMPAMNWLNNNTSPQSVVFTSPIVGNYLVVYTHNNVFFSDYAMSAPPDVFQDRAMKFLAIIGFSANDLQQSVDGRSPHYNQMIKSFFFYWRPFSSKPAIKEVRSRFLKAYTPVDIARVVTLYNQVLEEQLDCQFQPYRVDYVMEWIGERPGYPGASPFYFRRDPSMFSFLKKVYDDGNVHIFAVKERS
jgi:hypothetical protein